MKIQSRFQREPQAIKNEAYGKQFEIWPNFWFWYTPFCLAQIKKNSWYLIKKVSFQFFASIKFDDANIGNESNLFHLRYLYPK